MKRIAVMGAGAVGCYYGGMLARAGHPVTLVGRSLHVEAIRRSGLRMQTTSFDEHVPVAVSETAKGVVGAEVVLVCVKSTDTDTAAEQIVPWLAPRALVLSLQNGVDNAERLSQRLGRAVIPAVVYVATEMAGPGHLRHHGRGELVIGPLEGTEWVPAMLEAAGVPTVISDNVRGSLWSKLVLNCAFNALSAISRLPYGRVMQVTGVEEVLKDVIAECEAVAAAEDVRLAEPPWPAVQRIAQTMPAQYSSTAQDLMRGRRSEIDHLNGFIVRRGQARGIPTPVNRMLQVLVKLQEAANAVSRTE